MLNGFVRAEDNDADFPTIATLEAYREQVFAATRRYLGAASGAELNTRRTMLTWGDKERDLVPAHVFMRTQTHIYHHQGQIMAMCRLMEKPASGLDFPLD